MHEDTFHFVWKRNVLKFTARKVLLLMSLCLNNHHNMKLQGRVEKQLKTFLTLILDGGDGSALCFGRFAPHLRKDNFSKTN
jgi:hypothetical protein